MKLHVLGGVMILLDIISCPSLVAQEGVELHDDFSGYADGSDGAPNWLTDSIFWETRDGAYWFDGRSAGFAVAGAGPWFRRISIEATLTLSEGYGEGWKVAGVAVYADRANYWHLALVQSPDADGARHYVELSEMLNGQWLSQNKLQSTVYRIAEGEAWHYGTPYRLRIELNADGIGGTISQLDGKQLHEIRYRFTNEAVTYGRPALRTSFFGGNFDDVVISMSEPFEKPIAPQRLPFNVAASADIIGQPTGFFYVKQIDDTWWVVDPRGRKFYAVGTDHFRMSGHWCEKLGYAPYGRNMEMKFGSPEAWAETNVARLKDWNFNLIGAGGGSEAFYKGLAHTQFVAFGSTFSDISDLCPKTTWTGFPNVFHPKWEEYCDKLARRACEPNREDPWLFGYFLDNELEWYGKTHQPWGLFLETMKKPRDHSGKLALVEFLRERYRTIERFNQAWQTQLNSFDEALELRELEQNSPKAQQAAIAFVRRVAERYFAVTTAAIRKHDPNHMILGCRFAGDAPAGIWDIAGKYCDIVSFNYYGQVDLEAGEAPGLGERFAEYYRQAQRPLMITEWSFPALDSGLPCKHGAGQRFDTQKQRAQAYGIFQRLVFSLPFMVGSDYFMWVDEPSLGISNTFPEDTNYGLVNEQDEPYPELTEMATTVNGRVYELHEQGLADISVGELQRTAGGIDVPLINRGQAATVEIAVYIDGKEMRREVRLPAKKREVLKFTQRWAPGGHLVVAEVDPSQKLSLLSRAQARASAVFYVEGTPWPDWTSVSTQRIPLMVANADGKPVIDMPVSIRLGHLAKLPWQEIEASKIYVWTPDGRIHAAQVDPQDHPLTPESELCFIVDELAPRSCKTYYVGIESVPQERRELSPAMAFEKMGKGFVLRHRAGATAGLSLEASGASGNLVDTIVIGGVPLGSYNPLLWQYPGQNQWVRTNRLEGVEVSNGPVRCVLRVTAAYEPEGTADIITAVDHQGVQVPREGQAVPFRVTHDIIVYPGRSDFEARFVSIENIGTRPLQVNGYFFYLNSAIGGDPAGDETAAPDVPNYYAGGDRAWRDAEVGYVFGAEPWPGGELAVHFWLDEGGGQHPDARKQFDVPIILKPGETYAEAEAPRITVYGAPADGSPWREVQERLQAWSRVIVKPDRREQR
ncbi:MAG: beta-galactosidase [Candidatus Zipacnadales bacterium]